MVFFRSSFHYGLLLWSPSIVELHIRVWFSFDIPPTLFGGTFAWFNMLLSFMCVGCLAEGCFWYDCWLGSCPLAFYNPVVAYLVPISFYWQDTIWDRGKLQDVLPFLIVVHILLIPISSGEPDVILWDLSPDGSFSLRTASNIVHWTIPSDEVFFVIWQRHIFS